MGGMHGCTVVCGILGGGMHGMHGRMGGGMMGRMHGGMMGGQMGGMHPGMMGCTECTVEE